jgi:cytochrome c-type biogenesis protein CcmE
MTTVSAETTTAKMKRSSRLFMLAAFLIAGAAFIVIALGGINKNLVYYWTPTDLVANGDKAYGATIRLGGMVSPGTIKNHAGVSGVEFDVHDGAKAVHVKSNGVPPQMFRENIGVVVEGTMVKGGYFRCNRLMVSHSNEYRAPKSGHPIDKQELEKLMKSTDGLESK